MNNNAVNFNDNSGHCIDPDRCPDLIEAENKKEHAAGIEAAAVILDTAAMAANGVYAVVGDLAIGVCPGCAPIVLGAYQFYSVIPNSLSTISMVHWIAHGFVTGENSFSVTSTDSELNVSISVSQDTIVAVATNVAGWTVVKEPNSATFLDAAVLAYDLGRAVDWVPTLVNPTLSFSSVSGFSFSLKR